MYPSSPHIFPFKSEHLFLLGKVKPLISQNNLFLFFLGNGVDFSKEWIIWFAIIPLTLKVFSFDRHLYIYEM